MAALKWKNVDFKLGVIKVRETGVRGKRASKDTQLNQEYQDFAPCCRSFARATETDNGQNRLRVPK
jgi:hypothetical protein